MLIASASSKILAIQKEVTVKPVLGDQEKSLSPYKKSPLE